MTVLVVNTGSSSLKASVIDDRDETLVEKELSLGDDASVQASDTSGKAAALIRTLGSVYEATAVGHRVVHGGPRFVDPVLLDAEVLAQLGALRALAPLHQSVALGAIAAARGALPDLPHVAVFDTAFHATVPPSAHRYAVPQQWYERYGVRRYGFHGLSVAWTAERVPASRLVVCHLGGGCSVTAVLDGRSVDTSMGFSPLSGVPMATRVGDLDPEAVLFLLRTGRLDTDGLETALERESGLFGLSGGLSARVEELEASDEPAARFALDVFAYRVAASVAAMAAALGGLDALAFTGGVGEGSAGLRAAICDRLGFLGVELDTTANLRAGGDRELAADASAVRVAVVHAREDAIAARAARALLARRRPG